MGTRMNGSVLVIAAAGGAFLPDVAQGGQVCNSNTVSVGITTLIDGAPLSGPVIPGQKIVFRANVTVPETHPPYVYCCVTGGQLVIQLPDGTLVEEEVDLSCEKSEYVLEAPYVASAEDAADCHLTAFVTYQGGFFVSDPMVPGAEGSASISVALAGCCAGDVTGDSLVNVEDLVAVLISWGPCAAACPADANGDGAVDLDDLIEVILHWGICD